MPPATSLRTRAWNLAHQVLSLTRTVPEQEGADLLEVGTSVMCQAMGQPEGAKLEDVKQFVQQVVEFMQGYDAYLVCGCGYLSLLATRKEVAERYFAAGREPSRFCPPDWDAYFQQHVIDAPRSGVVAPQVCQP